MKIFNNSLDKSAITLSALCLIHCLVLPIVVILMPNMFSNLLSQELFHTMMVLCVLPISIYALTLGCKKHNKFSLGLYGGVGLISLVSAVVFGESHLGELGEKSLTTLGAIIIAYAHYRNYQLCQQQKSHDCSC